MSSCKRPSLLLPVLGTAHRCHSFRRHPGRTSSPLWSDLRFLLHTALDLRLRDFFESFVCLFPLRASGYRSDSGLDELRLKNSDATESCVWQRTIARESFSVKKSDRQP